MPGAGATSSTIGVGGSPTTSTSAPTVATGLAGYTTHPTAKNEAAKIGNVILSNAGFFISRLSKKSAYWLVVAGRLVSALLVIAGALVVSSEGLLVLLELVGGSLAAELVELDWSIELLPQPTRNIMARRGMIVFIKVFWGKVLLKDVYSLSLTVILLTTSWTP
jgi:hypothetical protein